MAARKLLFLATALGALLPRAAQVADAVRVTLGPKSNCVLIDKKFGRHIVCSESVTIAKETELTDLVENL